MYLFHRMANSKAIKTDRVALTVDPRKDTQARRRAVRCVREYGDVLHASNSVKYPLVRRHAVDRVVSRSSSSAAGKYT